MVKLLGAVMTGISCGYFGFRMSLSLKKRVKSLEDITASLEMLESEIGFTSEKLRRAFTRVDRNGLFTSAAECIEEKGVRDAWNEAIDANYRELCLTDADCDTLKMLGSNIGRTDTENQIKHIRYVKSLISSLHSGALDEYGRFGKAYCYGGVLTGLLIVIILL